MTISATDFQLRVNEYFTKLLQGEEIIIERYGKKFAVLVPYDQFKAKPEIAPIQQEVPAVQLPAADTLVQPVQPASALPTESLSAPEVLKLVKKLL